MSKIIDKDEKRRSIALSAIEIFVKNGIQKTTVDDVAKAAGVGKGTIYLYFSTKYEIITEIWKNFIEIHTAYIENVNNKKESNEQKILEYYDFRAFIPVEEMEALFALYQEHMGVILQNPQDELVAHKIECQTKDFEMLSGYLAQGIARGEFRMDIQIDIVAKLFASLQESVTFETRINGYSLEKAEARLRESTLELLNLIKRRDNV